MSIHSFSLFLGGGWRGWAAGGVAFQMSIIGFVLLFHVMFWMFVISACFPGAEWSRGPYFSPLCNVPLIFASLFFHFATLFVCRSSRPADSSGLPPTLCFVPAQSEKRVFSSTSCSLAAHLPSFYCLSLRREPCSGTNRPALQCFPSSSRHCWWVFFEFFFF